jgi:hypothetical protein
METLEEDIEEVTKSDVLQLFTWDRQRDTTELIGFIARREAALSEDTDS